MKKLLAYLNDLPVSEQQAFAARCGTSVGYLRKAVSMDSRLDGRTCIAIERESGRRVLCEDLRPDADWAYLRNSAATAVEGSHA
jgi:DNA-binding transcriptional regulator YdaS (Cro superfamily)